MHNHQKQFQVPVEFEGEETLCCFCCKSPISARIRLDRLGYVPGETINVSGEMANHGNSDIRSVTFTLQSVSYLLWTHNLNISIFIIHQMQAPLGKVELPTCSTQ